MFGCALSGARYRTLSTESYRALWKSGGMMKPHGALWSPMEPYGALWNAMEADEALLEPYGTLGSSMEPYAGLWSLL